MSDRRVVRVRCAIAGGGPAGMLLGLLLARAGVDVLVLEKHADFLRDFRGDTVHPSTLIVMHELGLLERFLKRPHDEVRQLRVSIAGFEFTIADFAGVPGPSKFLALVPQWEFLNFLADEAARYPTFRVEMRAEARELLWERGRVTGVVADTARGPLEVRADLVIAADGRHSVLRERAGLAVRRLGAPIDVLWLRLSRRPEDRGAPFGSIAAGGILVTLDRGDYFQCAYVIRKGDEPALRAAGLAQLREGIARLAPFLADRTHELRTWDDVRLLTVAVDRLKRWYRPGLLCIGDAAHAMSPIGGVGINLAVQDAVAAANLLAPALLRGPAPVKRLRAVQRRRAFPAALTQRLQVLVQNRVFAPVLASRGTLAPPPLAYALDRFPLLRRIPAYAVGMGVRPEHVRTREAPV